MAAIGVNGSVDVAVVGAGILGLALAAALAGRGARVAAEPATPATVGILPSRPLPSM